MEKIENITEEMLESVDEGVLYAGFFELNSVLYDTNSIYIRLSQTKDGLIMETMQMKDNEYEITELCLKLRTEV
ncbi:MAG: hypothetical protein K2I80_02480 [Ruminococcus sp.]|nr:hypothetical protein [Ruminococcus sp.]MDE6848623.1 hypothetical protein [Ruminococcus sp.]